MKYLLICLFIVSCASNPDREPSSVKAEQDEASQRALQHSTPFGSPNPGSY